MYSGGGIVSEVGVDQTPQRLTLREFSFDLCLVHIALVKYSCSSSLIESNAFSSRDEVDEHEI